MKQLPNPNNPPPRYYLDSNIFFYAKINDAKFGKSCAAILEKVAAGNIRVAISSLIILEVANAMRKFGLGDEAVSEVVAIYSLPLHVEMLDTPDAKRATELSEKHNLSPYDGAHIAVMERLGITQVLSADTDFDKAKGVRRINPLKASI